MTDKEVYNKYYSDFSATTIKWIDYLKTVPTKDLLKYLKCELGSYVWVEDLPYINLSIRELKNRNDANDEIKLEILMLSEIDEQLNFGRN